MNRELTNSDSDDSGDDNATKSLRVGVLKTYFEGKVKTFLDHLINQNTNKEKAANILYATINFCEEDFSVSLNKNFTDQQRQDPKYQKLTTHLTTISKLCRGLIEENDPFFRECRELVDEETFPNKDLKQTIGKYFQDESNKFLKTQSLIYKTLDQENAKDCLQTPQR